MQTNMTEKDKRLLVGMLIGVLIVAIGYWGIIPQIKAYNELETKIEKEEEEQKINKMKLANVAMVEAQCDDYEGKIETVKDKFYPVMSSSEVDRMLTEMSTKHNLYIYDLKFTMPTNPTTRLAYLNSKLYKEQAERIKEYLEAEKKKEKEEEKELEESEEIGKTKKSDKETSESDSDSGSSSDSTQKMMDDLMGAEEGGYHPNTDIYAVPVTLSVGGDVDQLNALLSELHTFQDKILVTGFAWGKYRTFVKRGVTAVSVPDTTSESVMTGEESSGITQEELNAQLEAKRSLTINLEVYMYNSTVAAEKVEEEATEDGSIQEETDSVE